MSGTGEVAVARAVAPIASAGGRRLWRRWRPDLSPPALDAAQQVLAEKVLQQERQRLAELGVVRRDEIAVPLDEGRSVRDIVAIYDDAESGRLLLTGEPGSGKTVAVLELVLGLLERRQSAGQAHRAVPVRLNAAGWDGDLDATIFFAQRISEAYPAVRRATAQALLTTRRVIVVLDGLDEMDPPDQPPRRAAAALQRLSEDPARDWPLVITCRADIYQRILLEEDLGGRELHHATRVTTGPLTPAAVNNFLQSHLGGEDHAARRLRPAAVRVLTDLRSHPDGPLARALRSPWLLSLTLNHLQRGGVEAAEQLLGQPNLNAVQDALFAALIPTAIDSQRRDHGRRRYTEPNVQRWLTTLADYLGTRPANRTEVGLHELWTMAGLRETQLTSVAIGLLVGMEVDLVAELLFWSTGRLWIRVAACIPGLIVGVASGLLNVQPPRAPLQVVFRTHRKGALRPRLKAGLRVGALLGLLGLPVCLPAGLTAGLATVLGVGLIVGSAFGLVFGLPAWAIPAQRARTVIRNDTAAVTVIGLAAGLAAGLIVGMSVEPKVGLVAGPVAGVLIGLASAVPVGMMSGLAFGGVATTRYLTATLLFRKSSRFTGRPAPFLDWANRAGLLRTTGIRYQFRHETYRDWLVRQTQPSLGRT